jgi:Tol biopolymer transport system component
MSKSLSPIVGLCVLPVLTVISPAAPDQGQTMAPYAVAREVPAPILFGEGVITTPGEEMNAGFTPDGKTVYFTRIHTGQRLGIIYESRFVNGRWGAPEVVPFSGQYTDYDPVVSPDGTKLFFDSNRPLTGTGRKDFDIWMVEKTATGWGQPKNLGDVINTKGDEFYASFASDGTLYFSSTRADTKGRMDIYRSRWRNGAFETPENLGDGVNSPFFEVDPYVAPDQSFVVFSATGRPDDLGNGDLYISEAVNGVFGPARHLGAGINSPAREYCPAGSPDGRYFFFTSFRGFGDGIPDKPWSTRDVADGMRSVLNGWGNVYQIDMRALRSK